MKKSLEPCYYWLLAPGSRAVTPGTTVVVVVVVVVVGVVVVVFFDVCRPPPPRFFCSKSQTNCLQKKGPLGLWD